MKSVQSSDQNMQGIQDMQNGIRLKIQEETDFYITVTAMLLCKLA